MRGFILGLCLIVAACSSDLNEQSQSPVSTPIVSGEGAGFKGDGTSILVRFGASREEAEQLLIADSERNSPLPTNEDCGAGPMQFRTSSNGLTLNFQNDNFVGWFLDGESTVQTDKGVSTGDLMSKFVGSHKAEAVTESTLDNEYFSTLDAIGAFGGEADDVRVEALYAGTNCFFR